MDIATGRGETELAKLNFTVKRVKRRKDCFAEVIGVKLKCSNSVMQKEMRREMEIRGEFPLSLNEGDQFEVEVDKKMDMKYSIPYFEIIPGSNVKRTGLKSKKMLAKFIQTKINAAPRMEPKLQKWKISIACCEKIIDYFGLDAVNQLINDSSVLLNYPDLKLNEMKVNEIQRILTDFRELQRIIVALQTSKIPLSIIFQLYNTYGERTLTAITSNPYQICYDGEIPFKMADRIAFDHRFDSSNPTRIKTAIMDYIKNQVKAGSTCIMTYSLFNQSPKRKVENLNDYLDTYSAYRFNSLSNEQIEEQLDELIEDGRLIYYSRTSTRIKGSYSGFLYLPSQYRLEQNLAKLIYDFTQNTYNKQFCSIQDINNFINLYETLHHITLDNMQKKAVIQAMNEKMFILTGGPGTGKTMTVSVIVECIKHISKTKYHKEPNFRLVAPTGKAAERMTELTNEPASTIHRALEISYNGKSDVILDYDYLIIDEGSMIDQELMNILLGCVSENTRVIIVGDPNQLPSVGPGRVLEEMMRSNYVQYLELNTIFRQTNGSAIVDAANAIVRGGSSYRQGGIILDDKPNKNFHFIQEKMIEGIKDRLIGKIDALINSGISIDSIQILTPKRNGELGVLTLNDLMQERYNPKPVLYENEDYGLKLKINDKVIQTTNNYDLGVFNGFIGTIIDIDDSHVKNGMLDPIVTVEYEGLDTPVEYSGQYITELELAYVLTIHKSQGSEYKYVFIPMHREQEVMLNRKLIYTAVTRAKTDCVIIGEQKAVDMAIDMQMDETRRLTNLAEFIMHNNIP